MCSIASRKDEEPQPPHMCFKNWSGYRSSCAMEADFISEGFQLSESMHGVRYMHLTADGDSSVYHKILTTVPYGRDVKKVECANYAVKCYGTRLEAMLKDNAKFGGHGGMSKSIVKKITAVARCAIKHHSCTGNVARLRYDLQNGPRHCFGEHSQCISTFCQK